MRLIIIAVLAFAGQFAFGGEELTKINSDRVTPGQPAWFLMRDSVSGARIAIFHHDRGIAAVVLPEKAEGRE